MIRDEDLDDDEREALAAVRKTGYRVHWRKAEDEAAIRAAIGGAEAIAPKRIDTAALASGGGGVGGVGSGATDAATTAPSSSSTSAWNAAGTFEQRHMGTWFKDRVSAEIKGRAGAGGALEPLALDGVGSLAVQPVPVQWGDSTADIILARGKTKHVLDVAFAVDVTVEPAAGAGAGAADDKKSKTASKATLFFAADDETDARAVRVLRVETSGSSLGLAADALLSGALAPAGGGAAARIVTGTRDAIQAAVTAFLAL